MTVDEFESLEEAARRWEAVEEMREMERDKAYNEWLDWLENSNEDK